MPGDQPVGQDAGDEPEVRRQRSPLRRRTGYEQREDAEQRARERGEQRAQLGVMDPPDPRQRDVEGLHRESDDDDETHNANLENQEGELALSAQLGTLGA